VEDKTLLEKAMLYTGCYCVESLLSLPPLILAVGLYIDASLTSIILFTIGVILFIVVSTIFFWKYSVKYKDAFFNALKGKNKGHVECDNPDVIPNPKATAHCPFYKKYSNFDELKKRAPMEFTIDFIYLCPDSITFISGCAKYHLFKDDLKITKKGLRKIKEKKKSCGEVFEIYYYDIMYMDYDKKEGKIVFYMIDGSTWKFPADKAKQKDIIKKMRARLRQVKKRKTMHKYEKPFVVSVKKYKKEEDA